MVKDKLKMLVSTILMILLGIATTYTGYILCVWMIFLIAPLVMCCICENFPLRNARFNVYLATLLTTTILHWMWVSDIFNSWCPTPHSRGYLSFDGLEIALIIPLITAGVILGNYIKYLSLKKQGIEDGEKTLTELYTDWIYSIITSKVTLKVTLSLVLFFCIVGVYGFYMIIHPIDDDNSKYIIDTLYQEYGDDIEIGDVKYKTIKVTPLIIPESIYYADRSIYTTTINGYDVEYDVNSGKIVSEYNVHKLKQEILNIIGVDDYYASDIKLTNNGYDFEMVDVKIKTLSDLIKDANQNPSLYVHTNNDKTSEIIFESFKNNSKIKDVLDSLEYPKDIDYDTLKVAKIAMYEYTYPSESKSFKIELSETGEIVWVSHNLK